MKTARIIAAATLALALSFTASPAFAGGNGKGKGDPAPTAPTTASAPFVQYNINRNVDPLNTWQVFNSSTTEWIDARLEIRNDETGVVTVSTFSVSPASSWGGSNIVQPTPRNPGETATLYVNGVKLNTAVASEWDALFQSWESPKAGYINIVTGQTAARPTN